MVRDLDAGGARYSQDLSEVDLSDLEDVKVRVNDPAGDVLVHLGSSDYLRRYKIYVSHAQGWRQQFQKLESVDLRYDNQIIVNPDMQRTAKQVALSPAVAKAAAAAGVKPAALVTRLGPRDLTVSRPDVPKLAFELTEKKLDPKAAAGGTKKAAAKTRAKKTVTRGKRSAGAKKTAATGRPLPSAALKNTNPQASQDGAAPRKPAEGKHSQSRSPGSTTTPAAKSAGQKPSPAVAKGQTESGAEAVRVQLDSGARSSLGMM